MCNMPWPIKGVRNAEAPAQRTLGKGDAGLSVFDGAVVYPKRVHGAKLIDPRGCRISSLSNFPVAVRAAPARQACSHTLNRGAMRGISERCGNRGKAM